MRPTAQTGNRRCVPRVVAFAVAGAAAAMVGLGSADAQRGDGTAVASLVGKDGQQIGSAALVQTPNGILIQLNVTRDLPRGTHGFHIHETGSCEPPDFKSAGGHFAPSGLGGTEHGYLSARGPHPGDLPNIYAADGGAYRGDFFADGLTLDRTPTGLLAGDGAALVIHATLDDYETDPAGNAGERIACGVIRRGDRP